MRGLILKDLINLKSTAKFVFALTAFFAVFIIATGEMGSYSGMIMIFGAMLPITALSLDERAKWDRYALTMPVKRSTVVIAKYLLGLILLAMALVIDILLSLLARVPLNMEFLMEMGALLLIGCVFLSITMPLMLWLGAEKGRIAMILMTALIAGGSFALYGAGIASLQDVSFEQALFYAPLAVAALFVLSMLISIAIYRKKEFS